jgi:hypothetical protein
MSVNSSGSFDDDWVRNTCMKYAGPYFDQMLRSCKATWDYLTHPDARARLGALAMIRDYWKPTADFAQLCEKMACEDDDLNVRCIALNCLISCYYGTWDVRIGRWLAGVVRDETQPPMFRKLAYTMLFTVRAIAEHPHAHTLRFPEQVDWEFVNSFLR